MNIQNIAFIAGNIVGSVVGTLLIKSYFEKRAKKNKELKEKKDKSLREYYETRNKLLKEVCDRVLKEFAETYKTKYPPTFKEGDFAIVNIYSGRPLGGWFYLDKNYFKSPDKVEITSEPVLDTGWAEEWLWQAREYGTKFDGCYSVAEIELKARSIIESNTKNHSNCSTDFSRNGAYWAVQISPNPVKYQLAEDFLLPVNSSDAKRAIKRFKLDKKQDELYEKIKKLGLKKNSLMGLGGYKILDS